MSAEKKTVDVGSEDVASGKVFNHSDGDIAAAYANELYEENAYTAAEEKRLRWKLDLHLVPILWFNISLSALDKITTSTAALYGMKADTGLTGDRYSWVGSAFYVCRLQASMEYVLNCHLVWLPALVFSRRRAFAKATHC